jgi:ankyrin repeat protein
MNLHSIIKKSLAGETNSPLMFDSHSILPKHLKPNKTQSKYYYQDFLHMMITGNFDDVNDDDWLSLSIRNYGIKKSLLEIRQNKNMPLFYQFYNILKKKYVMDEVEKEERAEIQIAINYFIKRVKHNPELRSVLQKDLTKLKVKNLQQAVTTEKEKITLQLLVTDTNWEIANITNAIQKKIRTQRMIKEFFEFEEFVDLFHEFCKIGDFEMINFFLQEGYNVNNQDENQISAIFIAIKHYQIDLIRFLLSLNGTNKVDVQLTCRITGYFNNFNPYETALYDPRYLLEFPEILTLFENLGSKTSQSTYDFIIKQMYKHNQVSPEFITLIQRHVPIINPYTNYSDILWHLVRNCNDLLNTKFLLEYGLLRQKRGEFNPYFINQIRDNQFLLMAAIYNNKLDMVELLINFNIDINLKSPIELLIKKNNISMIEFLLQHGMELKMEHLLPLIHGPLYNLELLFFFVQKLIQQKEYYKEVNVYLPDVLSSLVYSYANPFDEYVFGTETLLDITIRNVDVNVKPPLNKEEKEKQYKDKLDFISLLASHTSLRSSYGTNSLLIACEKQNKDVIKIIAKYKPRITFKEMNSYRYDGGKYVMEEQKFSNNLIRYVRCLLNYEDE